MIYRLHGKIVETAPNFVVIECGGVGYACRTTQTTLSVIGAVGEETTLYTHMAIHDTAIELFGFATKEELHCFQMLITVSGIGGKAGLAILSDLTPNRFALLVASGDSLALTKIKGIGKKSAERIILDLKDKLVKTNPVLQEMPVVVNTNKTDSLAEAMAGLLVLGYRQEEVMPILVKQDENLSAEELIKFTLRE
ncbi:MAG: Holliday junction branch migration protein RuvA, partial [Oscillospiraceae bacterium]|nr:Holliday junction branch migration protein RuvA [Oscillospiraceae bacterium]